jgi:hypothetical protein
MLESTMFRWFRQNICDLFFAGAVILQQDQKYTAQAI